MRSIHSFFALLLCAALLLCCCGCTRPNPPEGSSSGPSAVTSAATSSPEEGSSSSLSGSSGAASSEEILSWPETVQSCAFDFSGLTAIGGGIYQLQLLELPKGEDYQLTLSPDVLMLCISSWGDDDYHQTYSCYDTHTGALLGTIVDTDGGYYQLLQCGLLAKTAYEDGSVTLLHPDFTEYRSCKPSLPEECSISTLVLSQEGDRFLYSLYDGSALYLCSTETGEVVQEYPVNETPYYGYFYGGCYYLECSRTLYLLHADTGELEQLSLPVGRILGNGGLTFATQNDGIRTLGLLRQPDILALLDANGSLLSDFFLSDYNDGCILFSRWDEEGYVSYCTINTSNGELIRMEAEGRCRAAALTGGGLAAMLCEDRIYLVDLTEKTGESTDWQLFTREGLDAENATIRNTLNDRYGITLLYGSEGNDFDVFDYVARVVTDPGQIHAALQQLQKALGYYPEELLKETVEEVRQLEIYLCGQIVQAAESGISTAAAVTFSTPTGRAMAIDISSSGDLIGTFAHEFSHVLDDLLLKRQAETGIPYLSAWEDLLPRGVNYEYSYHGDPSDRYTSSEDKKERIWFVDSYSKTFPTEDRARIMEYLFLAAAEAEQGNTTLGEAYFSETPLGQKAAFLCHLLRECCPSLHDLPQQHWESPITAAGAEIPAEWLALLATDDLAA